MERRLTQLLIYKQNKNEGIAPHFYHIMKKEGEMYEQIKKNISINHVDCSSCDYNFLINNGLDL